MIQRLVLCSQAEDNIEEFIAAAVFIQCPPGKQTTFIKRCLDVHKAVCFTVSVYCLQ